LQQQAHSGPITSFEFIKIENTNYLFSASLDQNIKGWELKDGKLNNVFSSPL